MAEHKYVVFRVDKELYGLPIQAVERILPAQRTTRVPRTPAMILGVFELRGETIAAVDLRMRFEVEASAKDGNFVVVHSGEDRVALKVDSVDGIHAIEEGEVEKDCDFIRDRDDDFVYGVAKCGEGLVLLLHADHVLPKGIRKKAVAIAA